MLCRTMKFHLRTTIYCSSLRETIEPKGYNALRADSGSGRRFSADKIDIINGYIICLLVAGKREGPPGSSINNIDRAIY